MSDREEETEQTDTWMKILRDYIRRLQYRQIREKKIFGHHSNCTRKRMIIKRINRQITKGKKEK